MASIDMKTKKKAVKKVSEKRKKYLKDYLKIYWQLEAVKKKRRERDKKRIDLIKIDPAKNSIHREKENKKKTRWLKKLKVKDRGKYSIYVLPKNIRGRIRAILKIQGTKKTEKTIRLIGCSSKFLKEHIQKLFKTGMTWDNYGTWHIDHIKPLSKFDLTKLEQRYEAFNYINLQPLWAIENLKKGARY